MRTSRTVMSVAAAAALLAPLAGCTAVERLEAVASTEQDGVTRSGSASVERGNLKRCDAAGLEGTEYGEGDGSFTDPAAVLTLGEDDGRGEKRLDIEAVAEGYTVTGVVLKGGPAAAVYTPGRAGMAEQAPWADLQAPVNRGGNLPAIGHWFACVTTSADSTATSDEAEPGQEVRTITLSIADGELVRGPEDVVRVDLGQPIRLVISADETHEVTIPDFDAGVRVSAGEPGTLEFTADEAGTSAVELEGAALFNLRIA